MEITLKMYLVILPCVFFASIVDAIAGGGGLISLPAYMIAGLDYGMASGCNKFSACFGCLSATVGYARSGKIRWTPALCGAALALPGAWLGTQLSFMFSSRFMQIFMICIIPVVAAFMLLHKNRENQQQIVAELPPEGCLLCASIGFLMGLYDGFFGPGTGTFLILLLSSVLGMDLIGASATSKVVNLSSNITSVVTRVVAGQVIYQIAIPAMALTIIGGQIGARLSLTKGAKLIRYVMLAVLAGLMVKLIVEMV